MATKAGWNRQTVDQCVRNGYKLSCHFQYSTDAEKGTGERFPEPDTCDQGILNIYKAWKTGKGLIFFGKVRPRHNNDITYYSKYEA